MFNYIQSIESILKSCMKDPVRERYLFTALLNALIVPYCCLYYSTQLNSTQLNSTQLNMNSPTASDDMPSLLSTLAASLRGDLLVRGDAATAAKFDAQRHRSWNKDLSVRAEPCAFAMVSGVKDVVTVVKFCAENGVSVTVRGKGAHSPWGMAQVRERSHSRKI